MLFLDGSDYQDVGILTFALSSTSATTYMVNIPILDDDVFELTEELKAVLKFSGPIPQRVVIEIPETTIYIIDDDGMHFTLL